MLDPVRLREALDEARGRLDDAAARAGRGPGAVELLVAGKYVAPDDAPALVEAGVGVVGENRLQDLEAKRERVGERLAFDFIGHLQRRKVAAVLARARLIHSLDRSRLATEIAARAQGPVRLLLEVNVAGEEGKFGIVPALLPAFVEEVSALPEIVIGGLMAMPPESTEPERSRIHFAAVRQLAETCRESWAGRHDFSELSMGTSQDFLVAAEEGATIVRVGRSLLARAEG